MKDFCSPVCKVCFEGHETSECTEDKKDFDLVGPLAAFIGARLNYILPRCNSAHRGGKSVSTILVEQHKEKFWYARVYCTLAAEGMVLAKWHAERLVGDNSDPTPEFVAKCLRADAIHYRNCYMDAVKIIPRMRKRIIAQADYRELLFANAQELMDHVDELATAEIDSMNVSYLKHYLMRWNVKDAEQLKTVLLQFYERPSFRESDC